MSVAQTQAVVVKPAGKPKLHAVPKCETIQRRTVSLNRLMKELGETRLVHLRRIVRIGDNEFYRHVDIPTGEERQIRLQRGIHKQYLVEEGDADYLRQQRQLRESEYTRWSDMKQAISAALPEGMREIPESMLEERIECLGRVSRLSYPILSKKGRDKSIILLRLTNELFLRNEDVEFIIREEVRRRTKFVAFGEVAKTLSVTPRTLQNWADAGKINWTRCGGEGFMERKDAAELAEHDKQFTAAMPCKPVGISLVFAAAGITIGAYEKNITIIGGQKYYLYEHINTGGKVAVRKIPLTLGSDHRLYMPESDAAYIKDRERAAAQWFTSRRFCEILGIPARKVTQSAIPKERKLRFSIGRELYIELDYVIHRDRMLIKSEEVDMLVQVIKTLGTGCIKFDSLRYSHELLEEHLDDSKSVLRLGERVLNYELGEALKIDFQNFGVQFMKLKLSGSEQPVFVFGKEGAELANLYVGLMRDHRKASDLVMSVFDAVNGTNGNGHTSGRLTDSQRAVAWIARFVYMVKDGSKHQWFDIVDKTETSSPVQRKIYNEGVPYKYVFNRLTSDGTARKDPDEKD